MILLCQVPDGEEREERSRSRPRRGDARRLREAEVAAEKAAELKAYAEQKTRDRQYVEERRREWAAQQQAEERARLLLRAEREEVAEEQKGEKAGRRRGT